MVTMVTMNLTPDFFKVREKRILEKQGAGNMVTIVTIVTLAEETEYERSRGAAHAAGETTHYPVD